MRFGKATQILLNRSEDHPRQMVVRQPLRQQRRHQRRLTTFKRADISGQSRSATEQFYGHDTT